LQVSYLLDKLSLKSIKVDMKN